MMGFKFCFKMKFCQTYEYKNNINPFYSRDTASILGAENLDLLSPLLALEHIEAFPIVKSFMTHLLLHFKMVENLQRPSNSIILTVPCKIPYRVKESLLKFFFEETKAAR